MCSQNCDGQISILDGQKRWGGHLFYHGKPFSTTAGAEATPAVQKLTRSNKSLPFTSWLFSSFKLLHDLKFILLLSNSIFYGTVYETNFQPKWSSRNWLGLVNDGDFMMVTSMLNQGKWPLPLGFSNALLLHLNMNAFFDGTEVILAWRGGWKVMKIPASLFTS